MNRPFKLGLVSAGIGAGAGLVYQGMLAASGHCAAVFGVENPTASCSTSEYFAAFTSAFAIVTLVCCVGSSILIGYHVRQTYDGYVGLGDTFLAIGTLVALVEVAVFAVFGGYVGLVYGAIGLALTIFALKQERQVSLAVSSVMAVLVSTWVMTDPTALSLGLSPILLWSFAAGAYVTSLATGEELGDPLPG